MKLNEAFRSLPPNYLFADISKRVGEYQAKNPQAELIRMGIGDVTRPLGPSVVEAFLQGAREQGDPQRFHGYGPEQGYGFLRQAIQGYYASFGVPLAEEDIFVSDGAKSDVGNILDLFGRDNTVLIPDPVYPVYQDTNCMDSRRIVFLNATWENSFLPMPPQGEKADLIYLCSPNNPTGAAYTREQLKEWVDFANRQGAVILFDAAYEAFIQQAEIPRSIFEIEGAETCAIEFCSLSKTAGFTGTRCGYTVVPAALVRDGMSLRQMWLRRQTTKFNGVSYPVQRAAAAVFSPQGQRECRENLKVYQDNARLISQTLAGLGIPFAGGLNSPYLWMRCPFGMDSWTFFQELLTGANLVGTPGSGFGKNGESYLRLTSFNTKEATAEAMRRLRAWMGSRR
ncbi:MAG: LL-diaminopimelate aminotransferase [Oscillospiraceae bacterium]